MTYTQEFKQNFIVWSEKGYLPSEIFFEHGFDCFVLGKSRIASAAKRWRKAYQERGVMGLQDGRKELTTPT